MMYLKIEMKPKGKKLENQVILTHHEIAMLAHLDI
jgi:hypothetical protein